MILETERKDDLLQNLLFKHAQNCLRCFKNCKLHINMKLRIEVNRSQKNKISQFYKSNINRVSVLYDMPNCILFILYTMILRKISNYLVLIEHFYLWKHTPEFLM